MHSFFACLFPFLLIRLNILFVIISFSFAVDLFAKAHICAQFATAKRKNTQRNTLEINEGARREKKSE